MWGQKEKERDRRAGMVEEGERKEREKRGCHRIIMLGP